MPETLAPALPETLTWVNVRLLHPLIGGDRIRTYQMLRQLRRHCRIRYLCPLTPADKPEAVEKASEYCDELITWPHDMVRSGSAAFYAQALWNCIFGSRPFSCQKYANAQARQLVERCLNEAGPHEVVIADYMMSYIHFDGLELAGKAPVIVFQHNLESLIWDRHAQAAGNPLRKFICGRERDLMRGFEDRAAKHVAGQIAVSEEEEQAFKNQRGMGNILGWVPTGVDCDYFQPGPPDAAGAATFAFLGSMDWHANVDAILHFVEHTYPLIKKGAPDAKVILIGRNPPASLRALAEIDPSIEVTGTVEDVRPHLARASIMILPLRVGGGTRIKVFEGMAAGLAVVSTRVGVEGLPVEDGIHALLADEPESFAAAVLSLVNDPVRRSGMAQTARAWVEAEFSWERAARIFLGHCSRVL